MVLILRSHQILIKSFKRKTKTDLKTKIKNQSCPKNENQIKNQKDPWCHQPNRHPNPKKVHIHHRPHRILPHPLGLNPHTMLPLLKISLKLSISPILGGQVLQGPLVLAHNHAETLRKSHL